MSSAPISPGFGATRFGSTLSPAIRSCLSQFSESKGGLLRRVYAIKLNLNFHCRSPCIQEV